MKNILTLCCLLTLFLLPFTVFATPDEELHALAKDIAGAGNGNYKIIEIDLSGPSATDVVTLDNADFVGVPTAFEHDGTDFYMATFDSTDDESRIYSINDSTGDCTLIDETNVGLIEALMKNPIDDKMYAAFDEDSGGATVDSVGEIDLSDAQVDTNTIVTLSNSRKIRAAAFDAFGNLVGSDFAGADGYQFNVDLSDGTVSPLCFGSIPCWKWLQNEYLTAENLATNPDTNEAIYSKKSGPNSELYTYQTIGLTISIDSLGSIAGYYIEGLSNAPNIQRLAYH